MKEKYIAQGISVYKIHFNKTRAPIDLKEYT